MVGVRNRCSILRRGRRVPYRFGDAGVSFPLFCFSITHAQNPESPYIQGVAGCVSVSLTKNLCHIQSTDSNAMGIHWPSLIEVPGYDNVDDPKCGVKDTADQYNFPLTASVGTSSVMLKTKKTSPTVCLAKLDEYEASNTKVIHE